MAKSGDPPSYSEASGENAITNQCLNSLGGKAPALISTVDESMHNTLKEIRQDIAKVTNASVSMKLRELEGFLSNIICKGRLFCEACRNLGEYASKVTLINKIITDLRKGQRGELNNFLYEIGKHLDYCEACFEYASKATEEAKDRTRQAGEEVGKKKKVAGVVTGVGVAGVAAGIAATATAGTVLTILIPPVGIGVLVGGFAASALGVAVPGLSAKQYRTFKEACDCIIRLDAGLTEVTIIIKSMQKSIEDVKNTPMGYKKLMEKAEATKIRKLTFSVNHLKDSMWELYEESNMLLEKL